MAIQNHNLAYRPVLGGISIYNPIVGKLGTAGFVCTSDGVDRWVVSCYHVLCRINESYFIGGEPIYQPDDSTNPVARNSSARSNKTLDCAAAFFNPGIEASPGIVGIPKIAGWEEPQVGMRVLKSGRVTGVTEGVIQEVNSHCIQIGVPSDYPTDYVLSEAGDSGSAWICADSLKIIGLHTSGTTAGERQALGISIRTVFEALRLKILG